MLWSLVEYFGNCFFFLISFPNLWVKENKNNNNVIEV